ncbi:MAG: hypothetical protein RO469_03490 [Thermincola sp.]|jgi:DNA repair exonuclease SbcCD ATPase subunit|nr:hypothetical protein [Thermincola sp.]MDT3704356.1 hypothetical protein [Thermincola sp.]
MAKIGKIRFVNFTYNDNRHIYDQTFDFHNGEDTLLNLQNGGGKTVLVQMMMQPIIPKQKLKDRLFKGYFTNTKAPVYIMIEWILDDSSKKVLTGIGIKRVLSKNIEDESESLRIVTFISEYEEESNFDIKNIGLLEEERGIVRLIEFDRVVRSLSNAEKEGNGVWLFRWDLPEDKKEYARRLMEHKINQLEWKNLMVRINEAEAGLNSFFNDCKTNSALVKKWFIPTIEEQLNKTGNFVENIKELIKNHAGQLVKNNDMIREREIFESFKRKSSELVKGLEDFREILAKSEKNKSDLGNAYVFVNDRMKALDLKKEELSANIKQAEDDRKELEYEKMSGEYHEIADALQLLKEKVKGIDEKIAGHKTDLNQLEYKRKLLTGVRLKEELKNLNSKVAKFETELEKESLQQEDIKNIINDIEYSLQEKYRTRILQLEKTVNSEKQHLEDEKSRLSGALNEYEKLKKEIASLNDDLIRIRGRMAVFNETEGALRAAYPDFDVVKNINTGEYASDSVHILQSRLESEEADIEKSMLEIKEKQIENQREIELLEKEGKELRDKSQVLATEKSKKEAVYHVFENEKRSIDKIVESYQLSEDCLFDKEKLFISLSTDLEKYNKLINGRNLENSMLKKQMKLYEAGKAFELPEELKKIFDDESIYVEFGYEWLRSIPDNKNAKLKLVKSNPFLPYSLIVSQNDLKRIQELEFKGALSPVIPLLEREKLEQALAVKSRNNVHSVGELDFLIAFDDRILNKNYLKEITDEISFKMDKNNGIIENAQEALNNIRLSILKLEGFSYTRESVDKLADEIRAMAGELAAGALKTADQEARIAAIKKSAAADSQRQSTLENEKNRFMRKKEDIWGLIGRYEGYARDLKSKKLKEEGLKNSGASLDILENELSRTREDIHDRGLKIANIAAVLEKDRREFEKYSDTGTGKFMDEDIEKLESKLTVFTSKISGKIQTLRDILEDYKGQRNEKQKELDDLGIAEHIYMGKEFNEFEFAGIHQKLSEINQNLSGLHENKNGIQVAIAERNSDLKYVLRNIKERYGYDEPKLRQTIRDMDFDRERELLKTRLKGFEKELSLVRLQENNLQKVSFGLAEYTLFAAKIADPQMIEGDLDTYVWKLVKEYKEFATLANDTRNMLTSRYNELESEFTGKAEVFKNLFNSILDGEKRYQPVHALNAVSRVYLQIDRKLEQHSIDIRKMDDMENCIIDNTWSYLKNVYDEMNSIDRNSTIEVDGKRCKMLIISLPEKDELDTIALKEYLKNTIRNCVSLYKQGKSMDGLLTNEISTYDLFDRLVCIKKIEITLIKIEPNKLKKKTWKQVIEENSGGEKFVSAFVVFISLLTYMRGENLLGANQDSKVLIMDNPFGPITSEHLLKPLFEVAKKYNTQMICLTDLKEHTIFDRFNLIYSLNIEREVGREDEYIELKIVKKDIIEAEDEILSASMFKIEDKSRFELAN